MSTIKVNELATSAISLTDFFVKANSAGLANKNTIQEMSNFIGTIGSLGLRGVLLAADAAVTLDGIYIAGDTGTYTNNGGLVIDVSNQIVLITITGTQTVFAKAEIPITLTIDTTVIDGSANAVSGGAVFDAFKVKESKEDANNFKVKFSNDIASFSTRLDASIKLDGGYQATTEQDVLKYNVTAGQKFIIKGKQNTALNISLWGFYTADTYAGLIEFGTQVVKDSISDIYEEITAPATATILYLTKNKSLEISLFDENLIKQNVATNTSSIATETQNRINADETINHNLNGTKSVLQVVENTVNQFNGTQEVNVTSPRAVTGSGVLAGVEYTVRLTSTDSLTAGLELYENNPSISSIIFFPNTSDFAAGVSVQYTPTEDNFLSLRTRISATVDVDVLITYNEFQTPVTLLFKINQWSDKIVSFYGDSNIGSGDGVYNKPITATNHFTPIIGNALDLSKIYRHGIGGQKYAWGTGGGSVSFNTTTTGVNNSRIDGTTYDQFIASGDPLPSGTAASRGAFSSWLRIKTMYPVSIKDTIDAVIVMGATNDNVDATALSWTASDTTDTEWAASTEYATYNGDFNISTLEGGIASTIIKLQAWMPSARIILATPPSGRGTTGQLEIGNFSTVEYTKSQSVRKIAGLASIPLVDVYAETGINGFNRTLALTDGLHYYSLGAKYLALPFEGKLKSIGLI